MKREKKLNEYLKEPVVGKVMKKLTKKVRRSKWITVKDQEEK